MSENNDEKLNDESLKQALSKIGTDTLKGIIATMAQRTPEGFDLDAAFASIAVLDQSANASVQMHTAIVPYLYDLLRRVETLEQQVASLRDREAVRLNGLLQEGGGIVTPNEARERLQQDDDSNEEDS